MRHIIASLLLILGVTGAAVAYDDPKALVEAIYQPYAAGEKHGSLEQFYSSRLKDLYASNAERQAIDQKGAAIDPDAPDMLTFDPFIEGQNSLLLDLVIGAPVTSGDRAVVTVSFHNFDHMSLISLSLVKQADGWKVDDVASLAGGQNWLLSWLLQYDPFSVN
ncbi:MAG: DUF3828 domain-containing protein [Devosia sp.]|uniref:DUF3828 domain-containing protein n=1 Tax=Devosia sp. TaxID=1871048 RepID=UPI001AC2B70B|nr:DUF3828 domain-containing protein [Devosia sp.]MBN9314627.1 DUF3828 domain-containing protein [Devosia sp.]